ncbi:MAG: hypothetical protein MjAS7_0716 [Metallosphaera javensis (ex Sakai et al. 2022)]|nr:MAG: hypothetical protein MjAS7_0716 [Metallosphaera javensis (ex Sakai et al. 2022)]
MGQDGLSLGESVNIASLPVLTQRVTFSGLITLQGSTPWSW